MRRHILVAVVFSVLVLTAGCSGILQGEDTSPATSDDSATPDAEFEEYPTGFSDDGITDAEAAVGAHKSATLARSSWTVSYTTVAESDERTQTVTQSRQVNHADSTELETVNSSFGTQEFYTVGSEGWSRQTANNETRYTTIQQGYNSSDAVQARMLTEFLGNVTYTQADVAEREGMSYATYTATDIPEGSTFAGTNESSLENLSSQVVVAEDGRITEFSFSATAVSKDQPDSDVTIELRFSEYGTTTVEEPDWLDEAKN